MLLKTHDFTPSVYYNESRDFQFIGRLFDVVLNAVKTNADMLYSIPLSQDSDDRLLELMTLTLGFKPRHEYNNVQLKAFCSAFAQIIRWKGSERAFQLAINALANADGLDQGQIEFSIQDNVLQVILPKSFKGKTLLRDVLSYILPAGITLKFVAQTLRQLPQEQTTTSIDVIVNTPKRDKIEADALSGVVDSTKREIVDGFIDRPIGDINYSFVMDNVPPQLKSKETSHEN